MSHFWTHPTWAWKIGQGLLQILVRMLFYLLLTMFNPIGIGVSLMVKTAVDFFSLKIYHIFFHNTVISVQIQKMCESIVRRNMCSNFNFNIFLGSAYSWYDGIVVLHGSLSPLFFTFSWETNKIIYNWNCIRKLYYQFIWSVSMIKFTLKIIYNKLLKTLRWHRYHK